jgi:hypothetical protein
MAELDALEVLPEALSRIEFRGIRREAFRMEAWHGTVGEEVLDDTTAMNGCPIPDDHEPARHLAPEGLQKRGDVFRGHGAVLTGKIPLPREDRADGRKMVTGPLLTPDWSLARRGIGADDPGQGINVRFVYAHGWGLEYLSRRCPMLLQQLGSIALYAQTPLPGRTAGGATWPPGACEAIKNLAYTLQRRFMRGNDARLSKGHAESLRNRLEIKYPFQA